MNSTDTKLRKILVVDDDLSICKFLEILLIKEGFEVVCVNDGRESLELLKQDSVHRFDLVILDLMMPGFSGYNVLKEIQQTKYQTVSIMIVSARPMDPETIEKIRNEPNVYDFWNKPLDIIRFRNNLRLMFGTTPQITH